MTTLAPRVSVVVVAAVLAQPAAGSSTAHNAVVDAIMEDLKGFQPFRPLPTGYSHLPKLFIDSKPSRGSMAAKAIFRVQGEAGAEHGDVYLAPTASHHISAVWVTRHMEKDGEVPGEHPYRVGEVVYYKALDKTQAPNFEFNLHTDHIAKGAVFTPHALDSDGGLWFGAPVRGSDIFHAEPHPDRPNRPMAAERVEL